MLAARREFFLVASSRRILKDRYAPRCHEFESYRCQWQYCGKVSREIVPIAEFFGLRECLRNALRDPPPSAIFELDSLLVIMMTSGLWGCHRKHLLTLLKECYDPGEQLAAAGCSWFIRHIYREYNTVADDLAGQCIRTGRGTSRNWH